MFISIKLGFCLITRLFSCAILFLEDKEKPGESLTKQLPTISEREEKMTEHELTPSVEDSTSRLEVSPSPETEKTITDEAITSIDIENEMTQIKSREALEVSKSTGNDQEIVIVEENKPQEQNPSDEQIKQGTDMYYSDYRFKLRLRVHFRINEEAIRCLLLVR